MKPATEKLFFSYATVAQMGEPAYTATKKFLVDFYTMGPPEMLYKYDPMADDLADEAARLLNCDATEITYIKNTTEGINIASEALPLEKGDEILVQSNEYPANLLPWLKKRKDGLHVTVINGTDNEKAFQMLLGKIGPRTKAVAISSAQYYDGYTADIDLLSQICQTKGIFLVLDAVQSVGVRKIDLQKTRVDFLVCGGQKYLQAGPGIGFMYVNKNTIGRLRDTKVGIRSMERFDENSYTLKPGAARFQDGTQNVAGIVALHAALRHVNEVGIEVIEQKNTELLGKIKTCLGEYRIPFIDHGDHQSNIVSMRVSDPKALFEFLKEQSVYIKAIKDVARLSFIHESRIEDVETLAKLTRQWMDDQQQ